MKRHLIVSVVFVAVSCVVVAQNLEPAQLLPGTPIVGPAAGTQKAPAMAAGAGQTLLVFEDTRAGDSDLFGIRLGAGGLPIDVVPFPIAKDSGNQTAPKVSWNGQDWLVVYANQFDPGSGYFAYQFAAKRVSPQAQVLDQNPIVIGSDSTGGNFGVASDGVNWAVLYTGYSANNNGIVAKRISPTGVILDPAGVVVFPATYYVLFGLAATYGQNEYVFTWLDNGLRARRFNSQLQPIDPAPVTLPYSNGVMSFNGTHFLLAWTRQTPIFTAEVVANRLNAALASVDPGPIIVSGSAPNVNHTDPRAVWDGSQWVISWLTSATQVAKAARMTAGGSVLDVGGVTIPDGSPSYLYDTALGALPGGGALVAWDDYRFSAQDVFGTSLGQNGVPGVERCYSVGSEALRNPRVTSGPEQVLVTFRAESSNGSRILAQRLDTTGHAIDPDPLEVASATHTGLFGGGVAWNGAVYLVTWGDAQQGKIFARRFLPDATWLDALPIQVMPGYGADVAALGSDFLVTGLRAPSYPEYVFSYGARVRGVDGVVLDNPAFTIGQSYATRGRVAVLGGSWLVATESHATHDSNYTSLLLSFVDPSGVVSPSVSAGALNVQNWGSIDIASSGSSAIVVSQTGSNWTNTDVYARRILSGGSMPAPMFNVTGGVGLGQSRASIVWTGAEYVIGYQTLQNNVWFYDYEPDLYASRVTEGGVLQDAVGFTLWNGEDYETALDAGGLGGGRAVFAASTYVDGAYASPRISVLALRPAGVTSFGAGTPGCAGPERLDVNSRPFAGNGAFALLCSNAPAGATGLVAVSDTAVIGGADPFGIGILLHVGVLPPATALFFPMPADPAGLATIQLGVPSTPSLVGLAFHAQAAFLWSAPCQPSPTGLSTSNALTAVIQAP